MLCSIPATIAAKLAARLRVRAVGLGCSSSPMPTTLSRARSAIRGMGSPRIGTSSSTASSRIFSSHSPWSLRVTFSRLITPARDRQGFAEVFLQFADSAHGLIGAADRGKLGFQNEHDVVCGHERIAGDEVGGRAGVDQDVVPAILDGFEGLAAASFSAPGFPNRAS